MDLFILMGVGLLGAMFIASQNPYVRIPFLWKLLLGGGGGAVVYALFEGFGRMPPEATIGGFITLFVAGGFAGGVAILLYYPALRLTPKR